MSIDSAKKSKKGRPAVDSEAVNVRLERATLESLDAWRKDQPDLPTRPEAIRRILAGSANVSAASAQPHDETSGNRTLRDLFSRMVETNSESAKYLGYDEKMAVEEVVKHEFADSYGRTDETLGYIGRLAQETLRRYQTFEGQEAEELRKRLLSLANRGENPQRASQTASDTAPGATLRQPRGKEQ